MVDDDEAKPILDYPRPRNLRHLRRFISANSWYRRFIKDYAKICEPLTRLNKKDQSYYWGIHGPRKRLDIFACVSIPQFRIAILRAD